MAKEADVGLLLSTIYFSNGQIKGRKRLQKTVCILRHKFGIPFRFEFVPYFYGPYSEDLTETMSVLEAVGLVREVKEVLPSGIPQYDYFLTEKGRVVAAEVIDKGLRGSSLESRLKTAISEISQFDTRELVSIAKSVLR